MRQETNGKRKERKGEGRSDSGPDGGGDLLAHVALKIADPGDREPEEGQISKILKPRERERAEATHSRSFW